MFCMEKYKKCFDFFILVLLTVGLTGCINSYKDSQQNLILKGSVAELKETVMLDPAFAARQKQAEKSFFGFSEVIENADYSKSLLSDEEEFSLNLTEWFEEPVGLIKCPTAAFNIETLNGTKSNTFTKGLKIVNDQAPINKLN